MNKNMKFEDAAARLDEIVRKLESGEAPLDEALKLYEEGTALVRFCNAKLDGAEQKITMIVKNNDGEATEVPFEKTSD